METAEYFRKAVWDYLGKQDRGAQSSLAIASGIDIKHLNDFLHGRRAMKESLRIQITDHLKCDYLSFLQLGKSLIDGKSSYQSKPRPVLIQTHREADKENIDAEAYTAIPFYESGRMAAFSNGAAFDLYEAPTSSVVVYMPELGIRAKHRLAATRVGGDSMEPLIPEGSIIVVDLDDREFADNKIYAVALDDEVDMLFAVKRVRKFEKAEGFLLMSENQNYAPRLVVVSDWHRLCIGRVIWMWRSFEV